MTLIVGHRGARNLWAENSLSGFQNTVELGVECVEFDVHLTQFGELLVIHDATLDRTTQMTGSVEMLTPERRASSYLLDSPVDIVPTLGNVLSLLQNSDIEIHVEIKSRLDGSLYEGIAERVIDVLKRKNMLHRAVITSFSLEQLQRVKDINPSIRTLCSISRNSFRTFGLREKLKAALEVSDLIAVEQSVLSWHWNSVASLVPLDRLGVWVTNTERELDDWMAKGLRQITTDRPDLALASRAGMARRRRFEDAVGAQAYRNPIAGNLQQFSLWKGDRRKLFGAAWW
jgi:glycerophosphoryl diester phosphodiesterase